MKFVYRLGWLASRIVLKGYFGLDSLHTERLPMSGAAIIASNHASFLDPPIIGASVHRELAYLARDTLFRFPGIGWLLRKWNAVPIDRSGSSASGLKTTLERINSGDAVILFPEGTRSTTGELQPARSGIGLVVVKTNAVVIPTRIFGSYDAYSRHHKLPRAKRITIVFGEPLDFTKARLEARSCPKQRVKEIYQEVADEIMRAIAALKME